MNGFRSEAIEKDQKSQGREGGLAHALLCEVEAAFCAKLAVEFFEDRD